MKRLIPFVLVFVLVILLAAFAPGSSHAQARPPLSDLGLVAFVELPVPISLESNLLINSFRTIEYQTADYIIGKLPFSGDFTDDPADDVHAFVHKDGYILVYLESSDNPAIIFYNSPGSSALMNVASRLTYAGTGTYYCCALHADLQHRDARGIMQIFTLSSSKLADFMLSKNATIYDRSWALRPAGIIPFASLELDYRTVASTSEATYGKIGDSDAALTLGTVHRLKMTGLGQAYVTIIYNSPDPLVTFLSTRSSQCNYIGISFQALPQGLNAAIFSVNEAYLPNKIYLPLIKVE